MINLEATRKDFWILGETFRKCVALSTEICGFIRRKVCTIDQKTFTSCW